MGRAGQITGLIRINRTRREPLQNRFERPGVAMSIEPQAPATDSPEDRLAWLAVVGSGLLAALITALATLP